MTNNPIDQPMGWGDDLLSEFQNRAYKNELATFVHASQWQKALLDVATVLEKCSSCAIQRVYKSDEPSAILLFLMAHNLYLATVRSTSAGQCIAAYPTGRASVESALYGWYLSSDPEAAKRWHNKPAGKKELKTWGNEFSFSSLTRKLCTIDNGLAEWAKCLHQAAINFGAHPNTDAVYSNMDQKQGDDKTISLEIVFLHQWNAISAITAKFAVETGMFAIRLFTLSFPDMGNTLNLTQDNARLINNLSNLLKTTNVEHPLSRSTSIS